VNSSGNPNRDRCEQCLALHDFDKHEKLRQLFFNAVKWGIIIGGFPRCRGFTDLKPEFYKIVGDGIAFYFLIWAASKPMTNKFSTFLLFFILLACARAQGQKKDTIRLISSIKNAKSFYEKSMGVQSLLYNGGSPKQYNSQIDLLPFYLPDWEDGWVYYDRELYTDVPLMYDLVSDKLIVSQVTSFASIELVSVKVSRFNIQGHNFLHLGSGPDTGLPDGFYELLYDGTVKVFSKRKKTIEERIEDGVIVYDVESSDRYFIYKNGVYTPVKKLSSVLNALGDREKELKAYSKKSKLDFHRKPDTSLVRLVRYYDRGDTL
jgi:hypothetical protein